MSQSTLITAYLAQLTPQEQRVLKIAREHLESSFTLEKSIGFLEWQAQVLSETQQAQVLSEKQQAQVLSEKQQAQAQQAQAQQAEPIGTIQMTPLIAKSPLTSKL